MDRPAQANPPFLQSQTALELSFGMVTLGSSTLWGFISGWLLYYYLPPDEKGIPLVAPLAYSAAMLAGQVANIASGLPVGYWSDRARTRWGRRIPFIFGTSLLMPLLFLLLWSPPTSGPSSINAVYLIGILLLFNLTYNLRQIPYEALLPEIAPQDSERVRIAAWQSGFQLAGSILVGLSALLIESAGYRQAALIFALAAIPVFFLPFLALREKPAVEISPSQRYSFAQSLSVTLRNRRFLVFVAAWMLFWIASAFIMETLPFIATEITLASEGETMYFYLAAVLASVLCFPLVTRLSDRWGKRRVFSGSLLASALVFPLLALIGDRLPLPLLAQGILWMVLAAVCMAGAQVLPSAIIAEITDEDSRATGQRREGMYYAAWGLAEQASSGIAAALLPLFLLLGRSHTAQHGALGIRLAGVAGGVLLLAGFLVFRSFSSTKGEQP